MSFVIFFAGIVLSHTAWAGGGSGSSSHGGDVVVCFKDLRVRNDVESVLRANRGSDSKRDPFTADALLNIRTVELLDLYEATMADVSGRSPVLFEPEIDLNATVEAAWDRLTAASRNLSREIGNARAKLPLEAIQLAAGGVVEIEDEGELVHIPRAECLIVQIAVQRRIAGRDRITIDERLWSRLGVLHQSALIMHEWIYRFGVERGQTTSSAARSLVGALFRSDGEMNAVRVARTAAEAGFFQLRDFLLIWEHQPAQVLRVRSSSKEYEGELLGDTTVSGGMGFDESMPFFEARLPHGTRIQVTESETHPSKRVRYSSPERGWIQGVTGYTLGSQLSPRITRLRSIEEKREGRGSESVCQLFLVPQEEYFFLRRDRGAEPWSEEGYFFAPGHVLEVWREGRQRVGGLELFTQLRLVSGVISRPIVERGQEIPAGSKVYWKNGEVDRFEPAPVFSAY